jgi:hypothetical protein
MVWTDNAGTSFHAAPSNLFYGNGTAVFNLANTGSAILTGDLTIQVNQLNLNGSVVQRTQSISDLAGGGDIGSAATTVDVDSSFNVAQTTAIQTITLPAPTDTTPGRFVYVNNTGTTTFKMLGKVLPNGAGLIAMWTGAAWSLMGFGG